LVTSPSVWPFGSTGERRQGALRKPQDPARTEDSIASKAPNHNPQLDTPAAERQILRAAPMATAHHLDRMS
jgi:hypothetical protein